jgi:hypothetical protein
MSLLLRGLHGRAPTVAPTGTRLAGAERRQPVPALPPALILS